MKKVMLILISIFFVVALTIKYFKVQKVYDVPKKGGNTITYKNKDDMKDKLKNYNYEVYKNGIGEIKYVYLITDNGNSLTFSKYLIKNNGHLNIILPHNKNFIISLQANSVIAAKWKFSEIINKSGLKLVNEELADIVDNYQKNNPGSTGYSAARQNFYLCSNNIGNSISRFNYLSTSDTRNYFEFKLNIETIKE